MTGFQPIANLFLHFVTIEIVRKYEDKKFTVRLSRTFMIESRKRRIYARNPLDSTF